MLFGLTSVQIEVGKSFKPPSQLTGVKEDLLLAILNTVLEILGVERLRRLTDSVNFKWLLTICSFMCVLQYTHINVGVQR